MRKKLLYALGCGLLLAGIVAAIVAARAPTVVGNVNSSRLNSADSEPENWFTSGRDKNGSYFSNLTGLNTQNVARLGFAWEYNMGTSRGQEATPVVVDGVMYTTGVWGLVYAVDAATGQEIWRYDPEVPGQAGRNPCCDIVNRGLALWKGRVYMASIDGRLHALDAKTGKKIWVVDTIADHHLSYSSTGAVQIAKNVVVIGNSGSDMDRGGVRGYVSAYDLGNGQLKWRFYTVPPAPGQAYENPELALADKTWNPQRGPQYKGGGTVWDGFAYDSDLNLLYFGTGNAAPYDLRLLGPSFSDDLFTASILAVDPDTGRLAWYYQETPGDRWDFDAVQKMILADLKVDGQPRKVIMQASKNGFFYVLDRKTGELLSAHNYTFVNWASHIDLTTGRPVVTESADYYAEPKSIYPSWAGGHNWPPMSYNRQTGLVYIPAIDAPSIWVDMLHNGGQVAFINGFFTVNGIYPDETYDADGLKSLYGKLPDLKTLEKTRTGKLVREVLRAWDPVAQKVVWEHVTSEGIRGYDGGVMSTAGNLVFQGRGNGELWVYQADSGQVLKVIQTGSHIMAAPMTYAVNGVQYVAVQVGYGGANISVGPIPPSSAAAKYENTNRIIAFKLDGGDVPKPQPREERPFPKPPASNATEAQIRHGETKFLEQCSRCHVFGPSITPDLRKMAPEVHEAFKEIVLNGARSPMGMGRFDDWLSDADAEAIHAYLIQEGLKGYQEQDGLQPKQ